MEVCEVRPGPHSLDIGADGCFLIVRNEAGKRQSPGNSVPQSECESANCVAMERTTEVPRELTQVLQAIVIVFLAARLRFPGRWFSRRKEAV